jgi:hypothetical protein
VQPPAQLEVGDSTLRCASRPDLRDQGRGRLGRQARFDGCGTIPFACKLNHIVRCLDQNAWILAETYVLTNSTECSSWSRRRHTPRQNGPMTLVDASAWCHSSLAQSQDDCARPAGMGRRVPSVYAHADVVSVILPAVTQCIAPCAVAVASCTDGPQQMILDPNNCGWKVETDCVRICPFRARRWARRRRRDT